jgi:hypothetical protein
MCRVPVAELREICQTSTKQFPKIIIIIIIIIMICADIRVFNKKIHITQLLLSLTALIIIVTIIIIIIIIIISFHNGL